MHGGRREEQQFLHDYNTQYVCGHDTHCCWYGQLLYTSIYFYYGEFPPNLSASCPGNHNEVIVQVFS